MLSTCIMWSTETGPGALVIIFSSNFRSFLMPWKVFLWRKFLKSMVSCMNTSSVCTSDDESRTLLTTPPTRTRRTSRLPPPRRPRLTDVKSVCLYRVPMWLWCHAGIHISVLLCRHCRVHGQLLPKMQNAHTHGLRLYAWPVFLFHTEWTVLVFVFE